MTLGFFRTLVPHITLSVRALVPDLEYFRLTTVERFKHLGREFVDESADCLSFDTPWSAFVLTPRNDILSGIKSGVIDFSGFPVIGFRGAATLRLLEIGVLVIVAGASMRVFILFAFAVLLAGGLGVAWRTYWQVQNLKRYFAFPQPYPSLVEGL